MTDPVVELQAGFVRGVVEEHEDGFDYYAFKGIPYAQPPIGELAFKDPLPVKSWSGTLDCKTYGPVGFQSDLIAEHDSYDEDCLNLNVFTRSINAVDENAAVVVWIHGGEYTYGSGNDMLYGPGYLIRKSIVFVTVDFRLGVMGFLDLEDEVAPGNQGLKDLVMALQWVQQNIRVFGGDPGNVTIGGTGAGAASVHYLALSPLAKGLIHKVILQGNVTYNPWVGIENPRSNTIKLCSILGRELNDSREIVDFLRTVDRKRLLDAQNILRKTLDHIPYGPGVDRKSSNPVVPVHRHIAADRGVHLPCLVGFNSREGLLMLLESLSLVKVSRADLFKMCDMDFGKIFHHNSRKILTRYNLHELQVRRLYYKNEVVSEDNLDKFVDLVGDLHFIEGIHKFARVQAEQSSASTYLYRFSYDSPDALMKGILKDKLKGAGHFDDMRYLFKLNLPHKIANKNINKGTRDYRMMEQMTEMWTNFAKYGRPTVDITDLIPVHWKPISDGTVLRLMDIDEDLTMQSVVNVDQKYLSALDIKV